MHNAEMLVVTRYPDADIAALAQHYTLHVLADPKDPDVLLAQIAPCIAAHATHWKA
jgi:hypothetical protein